MPRPLRWTDDELRAAVAASHSFKEVCERLGISLGGGTYRSLRRHIGRLGLDAGHLPALVPGATRTRRSWTDDDLRSAVQVSESIAGVLRTLGYEPNGGMHRYISAHIRRLELDTSHFTGQAWARGRRLPSRTVRPLVEVLVINSTYLSSGSLRLRLIREGLKEKRCEICGLDTWRGEPLPLALDHINGDPTDNRIENLRILCPNCHALTDTWCARNRRAGVLQRQRGRT